MSTLSGGGGGGGGGGGRGATVPVIVEPSLSMGSTLQYEEKNPRVVVEN